MSNPSTPALTPSLPSTKRLSTVKPPSAHTPGKKPPVTTVGPKDVMSPGELCGFVDNLLSQLEMKFDDMSKEVLDGMNKMSARIDQLENTIQDLMHGDIDAPTSPPQGNGKNI
ncbi:hypothetical protein M231_00800 [Tremella mesenterica]|uniref:Heat shock factor-binding protein 1 n=1 Tax=Tremella mesenterica TaxID=5217 RepID=A0A4Q1BVF2_TREME|nr:hypothetical protein M231_00800 [Tremella mesenterica]